MVFKLLPFQGVPDGTKDGSLVPLQPDTFQVDTIGKVLVVIKEFRGAQQYHVIKLTCLFNGLIHEIVEHRASPIELFRFWGTMSIAGSAEAGLYLSGNDDALRQALS